MTILAICSLLLGTTFGRFYKVRVLLPAAALLFAVVCANFTILEFAVLSTCLLAGYASGLLFFIPELSSTLRIFARLVQTPAQKIAASETMRTACLTGAAVRPKGPNGTHRSFHSDQ